MEERNAKASCYNCNNSVDPNDNFCPHCGQANHPTKLTMGVLFSDFFTNFFNLDSKFFKTLRYVFFPAFLTKQYVAGKRRMYANPIRMFLIAVVVLVSTVVFTINDEITNEEIGFFGSNESLRESVAKSKVYESYLEIRDSSNLSRTQRIFADTIEKFIFRGTTVNDSSFMFEDNPTIFGTRPEDYNITKYDALNLDSEELFQKYEIEGLQNQIIVKQLIKAYINPAGTIKFVISNSIWIVILTILFLGITLKIIYIRGGFYYLEHVILQTNSHTILFIALTIFLLLVNLGILQAHNIGHIFSVYGIYLFVIFKKYYQQGFFKTFLKFLIYSFVYFTTFALCAVFVAIVSFAIN